MGRNPRPTSPMEGVMNTTNIPVTTFDRSGMWICVAFAVVMIVIGYVHHNDQSKNTTWWCGSGAIVALGLGGMNIWTSDQKVERILCFVMLISAVGVAIMFAIAKQTSDTPVTKLSAAAYMFAFFASLALAENFWVYSDPTAAHGDITGFTVGALGFTLLFVAWYALVTVIFGLAGMRERVQTANRLAPRIPAGK